MVNPGAAPSSVAGASTVAATSCPAGRAPPRHGVLVCVVEWAHLHAKRPGVLPPRSGATATSSPSPRLRRPRAATLELPPHPASTLRASPRRWGHPLAALRSAVRARPSIGSPPSSQPARRVGGGLVVPGPLGIAVRAISQGREAPARPSRGGSNLRSWVRMRRLASWCCGHPRPGGVRRLADRGMPHPRPSRTLSPAPRCRRRHFDGGHRRRPTTIPINRRGGDDRGRPPTLPPPFANTSGGGLKDRPGRASHIDIPSSTCRPTCSRASPCRRLTAAPATGPGRPCRPSGQCRVAGPCTSPASRSATS